MPTITIDEVRAQAEKVLGENSEKDMPEAVILLSGLVVGANVSAVARFTGYSFDFVHRVGRRLVRADIWDAGITRCDWFDEEGGGLSFVMDVCVAQGLVGRSFTCPPSPASRSTRSPRGPA